MRKWCVLPREPSVFLYFILFAIIPLSGMGLGLVAPSLPYIASFFQVGTSQAKLTIPLYLIGYALGMGFFGLVSDFVGRLHLLLIGIACYIAASLAAAHANMIDALLAFRLLQGFFSAAFASLTRAMALDITPPTHIKKLSIWITISWSIGSILGPWVGGYLQHYFSWRSSFDFCAIYGLIFWFIYWAFLPETLPEKTALVPKKIFNNTLQLISNPAFMGVSVMLGLNYSLLGVFNVLGPFIIQSGFGHGPVFYGHVALLLGIIFMLASLCANKLFVKASTTTLMSTILKFAVSVMLLFYLLSYVVPVKAQLTWLFVGTAIIFILTSWMYSLGISICYRIFKTMAGTVTAVNSLVLVMVASLVTALVSYVSNHIWNTLFLIDLILVVGMLWVYYFIIKKKLISYNLD